MYDAYAVIRKFGVWNWAGYSFAIRLMPDLDRCIDGQ